MIISILTVTTKNNMQQTLGKNTSLFELFNYESNAFLVKQFKRYIAQIVYLI